MFSVIFRNSLFVRLTFVKISFDCFICQKTHRNFGDKTTKSMTAEDLKYLSIEINLTFAMKVIADYWKKKSSYSLFKPQNIAIQVIRMEPIEIKQKKSFNTRQTERIVCIQLTAEKNWMVNVSDIQVQKANCTNRRFFLHF